MVLRLRTVLVLLLLVIIGGYAVAQYQSKAAERRDGERKAAVQALNRALAHRTALPAQDGSLRTIATGGLRQLPKPKLPADSVINYAVDPGSRSYFVCTVLERGGAFYANRQGTFPGPAASCTPASDPEAVHYALDVRMTAEGTKDFLQANPEFVSKRFIQRNCASGTDSGQLQGCFTGSRIYLIDLSEEQIRPEVSVTAAHEMLHAAWQALTPDEHRRLTPFLEKLAAERPGLREEIASYDPESRINELHSIIGTEQLDIGPVLERHYANYLANRTMIVHRHLAYQKVLDGLAAEIEKLKREFEAYEAHGRALLASGNIDAYNAFVDDYNRRAPGMVARINAKVRLFNRLTEHTRPDGQAQPVRTR